MNEQFEGSLLSGSAPVLSVVTLKAPSTESPLGLPREEMLAVLNRYAEDKKTFREWLFAQLKEGVHYGVPPGCEPKRNGKGEPIDFKGQVIRPGQWQFKATLYAAGAELIRDLLQLEDVYEGNEIVWRMMGEPKGTVVIKCTLRRRPGSPFFKQLDDNAVVGQGDGADLIDGKYNGANKILKMANKRSLVAAVINVTALRDLFTQDSDQLTKPEKDKESPSAPTREERKAEKPSNAKRLNDLKVAYNKSINPQGKLIEFLDWCAVIVKTDIVNLQQPNLWTEGQICAVEARLK